MLDECVGIVLFLLFLFYFTLFYFILFRFSPRFILFFIFCLILFFCFFSCEPMKIFEIFLLRLRLAIRLLAFCKRLKMTRVCRHCKMTKCVFFVRHCEPFSQKKTAWQSTNLTQIYLWIATNLHAYALQILAMTNSLSY